MRGLNVVGDGAARHRRGGVPVRAGAATTTCCSSAGSPRARASCRRSTSRGAPACRSCSAAEANDYYREKVAPLVDGSARRLRRRGRRRGQGGAARRRAGAALSGAGRRAVRAGARRGHGLRHAGRGARSRRGAGGRRGRRDRRRVRVARRAGRRAAARAGARSRRGCGRWPRSASASSAWWPATPTSIAALAGRTLRRRERRADERRGSRSRRPFAAGGLRPSRRRVAGVRRPAGLVRGPRRAGVAAVPVARRGGTWARAVGRGPGSSDPGDLGDIRARELRDAAASLGLADVAAPTHPDGMLPWLPARHARARHPRGDRRPAPGRGRHVRRGRPLLAS